MRRRRTRRGASEGSGTVALPCIPAWQSLSALDGELAAPRSRSSRATRARACFASSFCFFLSSHARLSFPLLYGQLSYDVHLQLALRRLSGRASSSTRPLAGTSRSRLAGPASARPAAPPSPLSLLPLATSSRPPWCVPYHSSTAAHQLTHACPARSRSTASPRQRTTRSRATTPRTRRSASSPWAARLPPSAAARPSATRRTRPLRSRRCRRRPGAGACTASARAGRARATG